MKVDQLGLLLWKNYVVRKRQPGILALVFLWPVAVFMLLYTVRDNVDPEYHPTCQFPARLMPQDGLLPFVQSYICSVGSPCDPLSEYELVPSFKNATLGPLLVELQPMLNNKTIISAVETLPQSIQLLKSMAQILTKPEIKALFDRGIRLGDLFNNHEQIKDLLKSQMPEAREGLVDGLFESSVKLIYLIQTFGSSNIDGVICSEESLKKYLILPKEEDFAEISNALCNIDSKAIPDILENLSKHLDFTGLLAMVDRAMAKFRDYNFFQDLKRAVETILDLKTPKKYIPEYLKLHEWLPKMVLVFQNVTFKEIDLGFINKAIAVLDPVFAYQRDWPVARSGFLKLNRLLKMVKEVVKHRAVNSTDDFFSVMDRLKGAISTFSSNSDNYENITQILDLSFLILQDGIKLTNKLLDRHEDDFELAAEVFDGLRDVFSEKIVNAMSYIVSLIDNIVQMAHHVAILHNDTLKRLYEISIKHQHLIQKILTNLHPKVYKTIIRSFSRLDFVEELFEDLRKTKIDEAICKNDTMNKIFDNYVEFRNKSNEINELFCSDDGKRFIVDVYDSFEFEQFGQIVAKTLSTMVTIAFHQVIKIETSNVTSLVKNVKNFMNYLDARKITYLSWTIFQTSDEWTKTFTEMQLQGRLDILGIHLSIAKMIGFRSFSFMTIKSDLENMDLLAEMILQDLKTNPSNWIGRVREHEAELIESFYLTITDKNKTLQILEYSNFTQTYCANPNPPVLLNFPKESNSTILKELVCYLSKSVQMNLELNITSIKIEEDIYRRREFNWTAFNEKMIEIYRYVDTLVHQEDQYFDLKKLEILKQNFKTSWTMNIEMKDVWEISVGLICKLFNVMESPLFGIQRKSAWKGMYGIAWATSMIFDNIEKIVDQIQKNSNVAKLSDILQDMPQTEILLSAFLRNLSPIILDVVDMITLRPVSFISIIDDYKERERMWPCILNESVGAALELRNGSREVVREIEKITCDPAQFIKEWREQPMLARVRKIFEHDENVDVPPFNWTLGYAKFRRVVDKLDALINDATDVVLAEEPKLAKYMETLVKEADSIVEERLPSMGSDWGKTLNHIDLEFDKAIKAFNSDRSVNNIWLSKSVDLTDRVLILLKFFSYTVHKSVRIATNILNNGMGKITLLALLGFDNTSPITIFHNQLPYILSTLVNGISDPEIDDHIVTALKNNTITCSMIFEWLSDTKIGLSAEDYRTLKNFTCDLDPENFNVYTDLCLAETALWQKPVSKYRSYIASMIGDLYDLAKAISLTVKNNVVIEPPFSKRYLDYMLQSLRDTLEIKQGESTFHKELKLGEEWSNYRLLIEGVSEIFMHIGDALKNAKMHNYNLETWELMENDDTRQVLKILEDHPEETIALVASLTMLNYTTGEFVSFKDIRKTMCVLHFNSDYWSIPNRTRFLREVCSFDPYQLLKTATSNEYYNVVTGESTVFLRSIPLTMSLTRLLDSVSNFTSTSPGVTLKSNIFNVTTWRNLSNETWALILKSEKSWIHSYQYSTWYSVNVPSRNADYLSDLSRLFQLLESVVDLASGGDMWQKLRVMYESSKLKPLLTLVEDMPNLLITAVDTFVSSERLDDFIQKLFLGNLHPCDIARYLIPPSYMTKRGLLSSITNFCQKIVMSHNNWTWTDLLPYDGKYNDTSFVTETSESAREMQLFQRVQEFQNALIRILSEGYKEPKIPAWWTSFEEGTLKDFNAQYKRKDTKALTYAMVTKSVSIVRNLIKTQTDVNNCTWCATLPLEILNSQLMHYAGYSELLCKMNRLNISEVHKIFINDFNWNKTGSMIEGYKYLNKIKTLDEFLTTFETTMHYIVDILIDFQNETYHDKMTKCFYKFVGGPTYSRPGLYITFFLSVIDMLEKYVFILDTATVHENINNLTKLSESYVTIWKPLSEVVKQSDVADVDAALPNATINVNAILSVLNTSLCRTKIECQNATVLYKILSSKRAGKIFRYDPKASKYPSVSDISDRLARSLDLDLINRQLAFWRSQASWDFIWMKQILHHLSMILGESGNLLDVASKIDFEDVSNILGVPDLADGIVNILNDKTVDKLFDGMKELLEDVEPFLDDREIIDDLYSMIAALESMEIFKNLGLLDMKYVVSEMFDNWDVVRTFLIEKIGFINEIALTLSQAKIDMISVFMKERGVISLKDTICSPEKLGDMLLFKENLVTAEEVSSALCQLEDSQTQNIAITLMKNLNFDYIFKNLMSANVKNILANANLTEAEGKIVLDNLGVASELFPFFKDKLSMSFSSGNETEESNVKETEEMMSNSQFLKDASKMLCGRTLFEDNGQIYKIISSLKDSNTAYDRTEFNSLPNDFCRETYKNVLGMPGGKIIWSYVKPLLRGQILYAPNTTVISEVMSLANVTFVQMEHFSVLMNSFERTLKALASLSEMGDNLRELQSIMSSDVMKVAIKSMGGGNFEGDFSELNLSEIAWRLKQSKKLISMIGMLNDMMGCVLVDRTKGFSTEEELEIAASRLTDTNEFLAGVIFLDGASSNRTKRSLDYELPDNITYKIRMDVDYVPSTRRLKTQFWIPGPESNFLEHLRYLRGFIQLQDSVDRAIVKVKARSDLDWRTLTQQMPYPCWKHVPFQTTLYESQGMQVCFYFALMMCVGVAVRHIVWERESQNSMVMSVMGLKPWRNTLAWFITSFVELSIVMICIAVILLAGKILPRSNPLLILLLLFDYIFSIATFCYMISTMFSSASLAAVTTVVMFLLTYMPYVIVIAMEAVFGLGYKLLICLSMSTSFCYGCLYAVRKEVQGTGLSWSNVWEESSPGDPMSLGLVLLMIAFDGCLYAAIGYLVTRYTNSGRGFHGLRSRSLWWADTRSLYGRPSYLAFVNNLYFTNDVLHPSATYQEDESDISSLNVIEKQIGVKFEGVRKVYHTKRGDVVAVEDFTLKLCEGEVTSLLGRNGAGKTTIIKMLTGMVAPSNGEICLNGEEGCSKPEIGVCPQENVLIGSLTPREHMIFYWKLKRPSDNNIDMQRNVNEMLASLELGRQEREPVSRLSGGTRRRLCVALAFLGSPRLVILDEPGAGVDPAARRRIWRLIDQHRIGRTVLLSTHHLDEADMLSDTVVVMHKGRILCTGSPLSLKTTHGRGYRLNVSFPPDRYANGESGMGGIGETVDKKDLKALRAVIEEIVPNATINEVSESEVIVTLPFQGKNGINNDIAQAAKALEDNRKLLGFLHFSLECDTLERVFLDLCARADNGSSIIKANEGSITNADVHANVEIPVSNNDIDFIPTEMVLKPSPIRQMKAMIKKRLWHFARDWRAPLAALVLPTMFVAVAMGFSLIRPPSEDEPPLILTPKLYNTHPTYFYSINGSSDLFLQHVSMQLHDRFGDDHAGAWQTLPNDTGTCICLDGQQSCRDVSKAVEGLLQTLPGRPTLDWIVSTHQEYIEKRYGGWSLSHSKDDPLFVVWYNNKGHHSLPAYLNALNGAILRASGVQGHLTTINHPLKLSSDQLNRTTLLQHVADVGVAIVLLIAFSLVGAQGAKELVRERLSEEKRILYLAGVHPITYWTTALIWDFIVFGCAIFLAIIVFEIFGLSAYVAKDNLPGVCLLLFLFAWAAIPFSHLAEKTFDDSSLSNMVLFCVNTFIGVAALATILVLDIIGKSKTTEDIRNILHYILMIFPQYTMGDALVEISKNDITSELLQRFHMDTYKSPLSWDLLGLHYIFLTVIGAVFFVLNLLIECRVLPDLRSQKVNYEVVQEDEDVARERLRIEAGIDDDTLKTVKLRKEYRSVYGTNVAVQNLSFGVQKGKCFGLLGVNGAGKSTTFKMLTTEIIPTAGKIILKGKEIGAGPLCNGEVGYCPQSDALDGFLTPYQCLTIHGEVCGLNNVPRAVETTLKRFDLSKYAHRRVDTLSGGNKRKLCAAISIMAPVAIVLMDEPTSGMDPATKNFVVKAVKQVTKAQGCVILTSHSVAECENLCSRVGILARAGLRCIGTPQHLKHKFGEGYIAFLRFGQPVSATDLRKAILKYLPQAMISSRQATAARLLLPRSQDVALSVSFSMVKHLAEELKATDYTLTQSSLDQVLVNFSEELDDDVVDITTFGQSSRNVHNMPNMYSSMDTICMDTF